MKKWYEMTDSEIAKNFDEMATEFYFDNQFALLHLLDKWKAQEVAYLEPNEDGKDSFVKKLKPTKNNLVLFDALNTNVKFYDIQVKLFDRDITADPSRAYELVDKFYEETKQFMDQFLIISEKFELKAVA